MRFSSLLANASDGMQSGQGGVVDIANAAAERQLLPARRHGGRADRNTLGGGQRHRERQCEVPRGHVRNRLDGRVFPVELSVAVLGMKSPAALDCARYSERVRAQREIMESQMRFQLRGSVRLLLGDGSRVNTAEISGRNRTWPLLKLPLAPGKKAAKPAAYQMRGWRALRHHLPHARVFACARPQRGTARRSSSRSAANP